MVYEFGRKVNGLSQPINHDGDSIVVMQATLIVAAIFAVYTFVVVLIHLPRRRARRG